MRVEGGSWTRGRTRGINKGNDEVGEWGDSEGKADRLTNPSGLFLLIISYHHVCHSISLL